MQQLLRKFYDREISEIKAHKVRLIFMFAIVVISIIVLIFSDKEDDTNAISKNESVKINAALNNSVKNSSETADNSNLTEILGLQKALKDEDIINPFKVDNNENSTAFEDKPPMPTPAVEFKPPTITAPNKNISPLPKSETIMLKGTAISGNKKMAIVQIGKVSKNDSNNDKNKIESRLLSIGDEIEGKRVIDIGKNFIAFDDGKSLSLQEGF